MDQQLPVEQPKETDVNPEQLLVAVPPKHGRKRLIIIGVAALLGIIIVFLLFIFGTIPYTYAVIRCGNQPFIGNTFAASYTYTRPGDPDYGPGLFEGPYFCTEQQAIDAGFDLEPGSLYETKSSIRSK